MAAYLAVTSGLPFQVLSLDNTGAFVAGRAPDCAFVLPHPEISRYHCQFTWDGKLCTLEDLASRRGTRINGEVVDAKMEVREGDKIAVGPVMLEYSTSAPQGRPAEAAANLTNNGSTRIVILGKVSDRIVPSEGQELTIGRDPQCEIVMNHPGVSRRHATVRTQPKGGCVVTDLRSTAGSFVNGHRFDSHELTVGDRLQIGPFTFQYDGQALVRIGATPGSAIKVSGLTQGNGSPLLLDDLTFDIQPSQFTGILGPSGAGKSTLLNTLAGILQPAKGKVLIDGIDLYAQHSSQTFGLVPQEDIVHRELTVFQALRFAARLRLPAATPGVEIQKLIVQTMNQLGVRERSDLKISRLSGGQRKRVCVAVELLAKPAILFLDEPSSGLDPATEFQLMEVLRELSNTGCTVVCTTHVMENAFLMDELVVLTGGCLAFLGSAQDAREYFGVSRLPALYDRLLDRPPQVWKKEFEARHPRPADDEARSSQPAPPPVRQRQAFALPILIERQWAILAADWRNFAILGGQPVIIAALVAWVTHDQSLALFFAYVATLWFGCSNAAQEIVKEKPIYRRERLVGVGAHSYLGSKFLFLFVITAIQALILYGCLIAGLGGTDGTMIWQIAALLGTAAAAVGIGSAISAYARTVMQAVLVVPLVLIPQILFSGHPVPAHEMKPTVYAVANAMPTFGAQRLMDVSFLWKRTIARGTLSDHWTSFRNLNRNGNLHTGDVFTDSAPILRALATEVAWAFAMYIAAWLALRKSECRREE